MRAWRGPGWAMLVLVLAAVVAPSCGTNKPQVSGTGGTGGPGTGGAGGAGARRACVERPDTLARPPSAGLPCELIPPGLTL